jgi:3-phenylpropionate/trans-cinnamate dioxygenase ferredoxin subunit
MSLIKWHKIAASANELFTSDQTKKEVEADSRRICIIKFQDKLFAVTALCPHAGGALCDGHTDMLGNIVCPVHHYRFQLATGRNTSGEGYHLKTYKVEEREDGVYVGI